MSNPKHLNIQNIKKSASDELAAYMREVLLFRQGMLWSFERSYPSLSDNRYPVVWRTATLVLRKEKSGCLEREYQRRKERKEGQGRVVGVGEVALQY